MCAIQNMLLLEFLGVPDDRRVAGVVYAGYAAHLPERRRIPWREKTRWMA